MILPFISMLPPVHLLQLFYWYQTNLIPVIFITSHKITTTMSVEYNVWFWFLDLNLHTHTHARTHTRARARTHTHTHTHTQLYSFLLLKLALRRLHFVVPTLQWPFVDYTCVIQTLQNDSDAAHDTCHYTICCWVKIDTIAAVKCHCRLLRSLTHHLVPLGLHRSPGNLQKHTKQMLVI